MACGVCGKENIPPTIWFWYHDQTPIHPWCIPMWDKLNDKSKRKVEQLAKLCEYDPKRAQMESLAGGQQESR